MMPTEELNIGKTIWLSCVAWINGDPNNVVVSQEEATIVSFDYKKACVMRGDRYRPVITFHKLSELYPDQKSAASAPLTLR